MGGSLFLSFLVPSSRSNAKSCTELMLMVELGHSLFFSYKIILLVSILCFKIILYSFVTLTYWVWALDKLKQVLPHIKLNELARPPGLGGFHSSLFFILLCCIFWECYRIRLSHQALNSQNSPKQNKIKSNILWPYKSGWSKSHKLLEIACHGVHTP